MLPARSRDVRCRIRTTEGVYAAIHFDQRRLLFGFKHEAVQERHLIEQANDRA